MRVTTTKYIRKALYVDAVRITKGNFEAVAEWCQGDIQLDDSDSLLTNPKKFIRVRVHNPKNSRQTKAYVGDWLLYTERGYKIYTNKAFHASFEEVNPDDPQPGDIIMGSEELIPGLTVNEGIKWLRENHPNGVINPPEQEQAKTGEKDLAKRLKEKAA